MNIFSNWGINFEPDNRSVIAVMNIFGKPIISINLDMIEV